MTQAELKIAAKDKNSFIPENISLIEAGYFSKIKEIATDFRSNKIESAEKCVELIAAVDRQFDFEVDEKLNHAHQFTVFQENIRLAGTLRSEINKSTSTIEIAKLAVECIGKMTGDEHFYAQNVRKLV